MADLALAIVALAAFPVLVGAPWLGAWTRRPRPFDRLLLESWATGFAILCALAVSLGGLGNSLTACAVLWAASGPVGLVVFWRRRQKLAPARADARSVVILVFAALTAMGAGSPWTTSADDAAHLAEVRRVATDGEIFPSRSFHAAGEVPAPDPRFGAVHTLYGLVARATGVEPERVWIAGRVVGTVLLWLAFLQFCSALLPAGGALLATLLAIGFFGGSRFPVQLVAMYPLWIGMSVVWLALAAWLERLDDRRAGWIDLAWLPALVVVHYFPALVFWLLFGCVLLARGVRESVSWLVVRRRPVGIALAAVVATLALRVALSYESANPIHRGAWNISVVAGDWQIYQPAMLIEALGPFGLLAPLLGAGLLVAGRISGAGARFLVLAAWIPFLVPGNPLVVTALRPYLGFLLFRALLASPWPAFYGLLAARFVPRRWHFGLTVLIGALVLAQLWRGRPAGDASDYDEAWRTAAVELSAALAPDAVILSDPYTMLGLPAFGDLAVVAVPDGRSSPRDPRAFERLFAASVAMDPRAREDLAIAAARQERATHLVVTRWERPPSGYLYSPGEIDADRFVAAWEERGARRVGRFGPFELLELSGLRAGTLGSLPQPAPAPPIVPQLAATVARPTVRAGDVLRLNFSASPVRRPGGILMPRLFLRVDREPLAGGDARLGKLVRKLEEQREGTKQRQRLDVTPSPALILAAEVERLPLELEIEFPLSAALAPRELSPESAVGLGGAHSRATLLGCIPQRGQLLGSHAPRIRDPAVRVGLVFDRLGTGGTERQMELLIRHSSDDVDYRLCAFANGDDTQRRLAELAPLTVLGRGALDDLTLPWRLARWASRERCDVVLAAHRFAGLNAKLARLCGLRAPVVCALRGRARYGRKRRLIYDHLDITLMRLAAAVVINSAAIRETLPRSGWLRERIEEIPNGLAPRTPPAVGREERRSGLGWGASDFVVASTGRIVDVKAPLTAAECIVALRAKGVPARLLWIGDGPMRAQLERSVGEGSALHCTGLVADAREWLPAADVYFHPSHWENTSNAILEAMSCGLPVVARALPGNREILREGRDGILFDHRDAAEAALARLAGEPELGERMGSAGAAQVRDRYDPGAMADAHRALFLRCGSGR